MIESLAWTDALPDSAAICKRASAAAWHRADAGPASACVVLTDDGTVQDLNRRFRHTDAPTNVLSFEAMTAAERDDAWRRGETVLLGDVAIAFATVRREAADGQRTLAEHLSHMVVHGTLHLMGYDHDTDEDASVMERLEVRILDSLGVSNPYQRENGDTP